MGQSKGGGYQKLPTVQPGQQSLLDFINSFAPGALSQAQSGYAQFLPGGGGGEALKQQALESYKQQYIPAALNAFGTDNKGSSALNQALAQGASNLNTNVAAQLAQNQLGAAQGLGSLGAGAGQLGLGTSTFNYAPKQLPLWQQLLTGSVPGFSSGAGAVVGRSIFG